MSLTLDNRRTAGVALEGVTRVLGGKRVLDGLDLRVRAGAGSGSSGGAAPASRRCSALVAGLDEPDAGVVSVCGETSPPAVSRAAR